jgi:hypothetical protein
MGEDVVRVIARLDDVIVRWNSIQVKFDAPVGQPPLCSLGLVLTTVAPRHSALTFRIIVNKMPQNIITFSVMALHTVVMLSVIMPSVVAPQPSTVT